MPRLPLFAPDVYDTPTAGVPLFSNQGVWTRQPPENPRLNYSNPLLRQVADVWVGSQPRRTLVNNFAVEYESYTNNPILGNPSKGMMAASNFVYSNNELECANSRHRWVPSDTELTVAVVYRFQDTSLRNNALFGYNVSTSNRVLVHYPWGSTIIWDCGSNASTNELTSASFTKTTNVETAIFIAGLTKGREIWREGSKIANDITKTGSIPARVTTGVWDLQAVGGVNNDKLDTYLLLTVGRAWSDAECLFWSRNPWQIFL